MKEKLPAKKLRGKPIQKGQRTKTKGGSLKKFDRVHSISTALCLNRTLLADKIKSIMSLTPEEMKYKFEDKLTPSIDLALMKIMSGVLREGDHHQLEFLLNRSVGKVKEEIEHTSPDGSMTPKASILSSLSDEQLKQLEKINKAVHGIAE